jgi:hypothetical protein
VAGAWSATAGLLVIRSPFAAGTAILAGSVLALSVWLFRGEREQSYPLASPRAAGVKMAGGPGLPAAESFGVRPMAGQPTPETARRGRPVLLQLCSA